MTGMRLPKPARNSALISARWTVVRLPLPVIMKNARANIAKSAVKAVMTGMRQRRAAQNSALISARWTVVRQVLFVKRRNARANIAKSDVPSAVNGILKVQENVVPILINMMNPTVRFQAIIIAIQIPAAGSMMIVR